MAFLTINGVEVQIADDSARFDVVEIGSRKRAFDGTPMVTRQRLARELSVRTSILAKAEAFAVSCLAAGLGHVFSFASHVYSSKGKGPSASTDVTYSATGGPVTGVGRITVAGTTGTTTYSAVAALRAGFDSTEWTVLVWRKESGTWFHYIVKGNSTAWKNGSTVAVPAWLTVTPGGSVTIAATDATAYDYSDLVTLPFLIPDSWVSQLDAWLRTGTRAFPPLATLHLEGNAVPTTHAFYAKGEVEGEELLQATVAGSWEPAARRLSIKFREN